MYMKQIHGVIRLCCALECFAFELSECLNVILGNVYAQINIEMYAKENEIIGIFQKNVFKMTMLNH